MRAGQIQGNRTHAYAGPRKEPLLLSNRLGALPGFSGRAQVCSTGCVWSFVFVLTL